MVPSSVSRRFRALAILAALALTSACASLPPVTTGAFYGSRSVTLSNGLQVVVVPVANAPIVWMQFTYRVGSNDEEPGTTGLAHYMEHLMFRAGQKADAGHLERIAQAGGSANAYTTNETTSYVTSVPPEKFAETLAREVERVTRLTPNAEGARTERDVVLRELSQRGDSTNAKFGRAFARALWGDHPYGRNPGGHVPDVEKLTLADAQAFHAKWYTVSNLQVVITGKVDPDATLALVEADFGDLPARPVPPRTWAKPAPPKPERASVVMDGPDIGSPSLSRARILSVGAPIPPSKLAAATVVATALAGSADGRLNRPLVYDEALASGVSFSIANQAQGTLVVSLRAAPLDPAELDRLDQRLGEVLADIRAKGLTQGELDRVKKRLAAGRDTIKDKPAALASRFSEAFVDGFGPADVEAWPNLLDAVTLADANALLGEVLAPEGWVTGRLLPRRAGAAKPAAK